MTPLTKFNNKFTISVLENKTVYNYRISDIVNLWLLAITKSENLFVTPINVKNPYTNMDFSKSTLYNIYFKLLDTGFIIPSLINSFVKYDMDIKMFSIKNYTRTFVLVFLPLPIIWLQIYIASKIPVIEYYTLMEKLLLTCFTINIANALESGIIFILINEDFGWTKYIKRKIKNVNNYKFIIDKEDEKEIYKYLVNINRIYSIIINSIFVITISIYLA